MFLYARWLWSVHKIWFQVQRKLHFQGFNYAKSTYISYIWIALRTNQKHVKNISKLQSQIKKKFRILKVFREWILIFLKKKILKIYFFCSVQCNLRIYLYVAFFRIAKKAVFYGEVFKKVSIYSSSSFSFKK